MRGFASDLRTYIRSMRGPEPTRPSRSWSSLAQLIRHYPKWKRRLNTPGASPLADGTPWISFAAIDFLDEILRPDWTAFEYGSGGSTVFLARRVRKVHSIEHDPVWHEELCGELARHDLSNVELDLVEARKDPEREGDATDPHAYRSSSPQWGEWDFRPYCESIDRLGPAEGFDLILIDGRARPSCLMHAVRRVKAGGYIVLDNSDRETYARGMESLTGGFARTDFPGPTPYVSFYTRTSAFRAPARTEADQTGA